MFEELSDQAEYKLYEHWCNLRDDTSEKDLKLVNHLLDCLIEFTEEYPKHEISNGFLRDLRGLD